MGWSLGSAIKLYYWIDGNIWGTSLKQIECCSSSTQTGWQVLQNKRQALLYIFKSRHPVRNKNNWICSQYYLTSLFCFFVHWSTEERQFCSTLHWVLYMEVMFLYPSVITENAIVFETARTNLSWNSWALYFLANGAFPATIFSQTLKYIWWFSEGMCYPALVLDIYLGWLTYTV